MLNKLEKKKKLNPIDFIQDFGCARLEQLQILFDEPNNNFKKLLYGNMISKKDDIFVHNTKAIDENMLIAIDVLCKFKKRLQMYYTGYHPVKITFLTKDNNLYHIIVGDEENRKGIVKLLNSNPLPFVKADKIVLAFPNETDLNDIDCSIPIIYCTYPGLEIIN